MLSSRALRGLWLSLEDFSWASAFASAPFVQIVAEWGAEDALHE